MPGQDAPDGPTIERVEGHVFEVGYDDSAFAPERIVTADGLEIEPFPIVPMEGGIAVRPAVDQGETMPPNEIPWAMARQAAEAHCARTGRSLAEGVPQLIVTDGWHFPPCS